MGPVISHWWLVIITYHHSCWSKKIPWRSINYRYPLVNIQKAMENGPVEIVDFPNKNGGSFHCKMLVHQRVLYMDDLGKSTVYKWRKSQKTWIFWVPPKSQTETAFFVSHHKVPPFGYGSKLGTPKLWMVNTKLDIHICGPLNGLPFWPTSIFLPTVGSRERIASRREKPSLDRSPSRCAPHNLVRP